jgi:hypothetical protein
MEEATEGRGCLQSKFTAELSQQFGQLALDKFGQGRAAQS